jgi:hypothetical protein
VTPSLVHKARPPQPIGTSLWEAGARICGLYAGPAVAAGKAKMVAALHCVSYFTGSGVTHWCGRVLIVEVASLVGEVSRRYWQIEEQRHGIFCSEWVPFLELKKLQLYKPDGLIQNAAIHYRMLCSLGVQIKAVMCDAAPRKFLGDPSVSCLPPPPRPEPFPCLVMSDQTRPFLRIFNGG